MCPVNGFALKCEMAFPAVVTERENKQTIHLFSVRIVRKLLTHKIAFWLLWYKDSFQKCIHD